jgi:Spy/CpxP family protein refolding chaperone
MSVHTNKSLALVALSLPILFTFTTGFSQESAVSTHISGSEFSAPTGSLGGFGNSSELQLAHISGGTSDSLFKSKINWPSELVASLDDTASIQKTATRKQLRDGFLIENVPGLLMKSLTEEELSLAKFSSHQNNTNSNNKKAGMMLASLSITDATEFIANASNTDSAGSYVHPGLQSNESMMGVPEGLDAARKETQEKETQADDGVQKKNCPKKEGSKGATADKAKCDSKKGDPHHWQGHMQGHGGYGHHKAEGSKGEGHHGTAHHGSAHHGSSMHSGSAHHGSAHHGHSSKHKHNPFVHIMNMKDQLNLTADQVEKLKAAEFEYNKVLMRSDTEHKIAHMEMDRLVHSTTTDEKRLRELADIISNTKSQKIHAMIEAKITILGTLTDEQKAISAELHGAHGHGNK